MQNVDKLKEVINIPQIHNKVILYQILQSNKKVNYYLLYSCSRFRCGSAGQHIVVSSFHSR